MDSPSHDIASILSPGGSVGIVEEAVIPSFSKQLEDTLAEVLPSDDPLDSPDFDPIKYINEQFPDQSSVNQNIDSFLASLKRDGRELSDKIAKDVRDFSCQRTRTEQSVETARKAMEELFVKVTAIKRKATDSEVMVQEICRDIKSLDYAEQNLTASIDALRNLHMLVSLVEQLERMLDDKQWRDSASLLSAIADLLTKFDNYYDVPKIQALINQVNIYKAQIKTQIFADFKRLVPESALRDDPVTQKMLSDACLVVEVLEKAAKTEILKWFTNKQMEAYKAVFSPGEEGGTLAQTERRYAWLRRELRNYADNFAGVFLDKWHVPLLLTKEFCSITRTDLIVILKNQGVPGGEGADTTVLIKALQRTIDFEKEMDVKFKKDLEAQQVATANEEGGSVSVHTTSFVFDKSISSCFQQYMQGYVDLEGQNIRELVERLGTEENWLPEQDDASEEARLAGSDELFVYIQKSIKRCARLTTDLTFYKLFCEYCTGLSLYCDLLWTRVPGGGEENPYPNPLSLSGSTALCLVINTAEYCAETCPALGETVKKAIDSEFRDKIDMTTSQEAFTNLLNKSVTALAQGVSASLEKELGNMIKLPWSTWESVGDQSEYVLGVNRELNELLPVAKALLTQRYYNFFCTQLVGVFIPKYVEAIFKTRRIGDLGAQQLSLDAHALKLVLLSIPQIEKKEEEVDENGKPIKKPQKRPGAAERAFTRYVNKEMGKAEGILKTVVSPPDHLINTFKALVPGGSADDLTKIMSLRGHKKHEQQALVDNYNALVGADEKITLVNRGMNIQSLFKIPGMYND
mmetsp:Transcript_50232/g.98478  ORF Transcript_50232/g.98478 Transcript_50232/m.98478 type:complete len:804 (-) Transcript_50232:278-2689(-)